MPRKPRNKPYTPPIPFNGDHGTGTAAAMAGTRLEAVEDEEGRNPNNMGRRVREDRIKRIKLSMRQEQAAYKIRDAYCRVEMLSSGSPLKEQVDASPKPDAVIASQVDAQSELHFVMSAVPNAMRPVIEHVCWHNRPLNQMPDDRANFKVALDMVANKLRY